MKLNLNTLCKVELTPLGISILEKHIEPFRQHLDEDYIEKMKREREYALWELMHIFGECLTHGSPEVPFVNNEVEFLIKI